MLTRDDIDSIYVFDNKGNNFGTAPLTETIDVNSLLEAAKIQNCKFVWLRKDLRH